LIVARAQRRLDVGRTAHRFHGAREFRQNGISCGVEDSSAMHRHERLEYFFVASKSPQRLLFILAHQAAEFGNIGRENGGELPLNRLRT